MSNKGAQHNMPKAGDIVLIPFPFTDLSSTKSRPALLLTNPDRDGDFIAAAVTSQSGHDASVALDPAHITNGSLPKASWVRADKLFTFQRSIVQRHVASVQPQVMRDTLAVLCPAIGCCAEA